MSMTSRLRTEGSNVRGGFVQALRRETWETSKLTIAWHSRKRDIHPHRQLLASAFVDHDRSVDRDASIVHELNGHERQYDGSGKERHCIHTVVILAYFSERSRRTHEMRPSAS
jgi:hypothetical protein